MPIRISPDTLRQIATEYGTPVYVYHAERIREQYENLVTAFNETRPRIFYACKALTNINILKYINRLGCNIDCSSINEAKLALKAGFEPGRILYTSNSIDISEIEEAKSLGIYINIDSLSNLEKFARNNGSAYPVGLRLKPNILAGGNLKISTGHARSKFGIPLEDIDEVLRIQKETGLIIQGLQIHTGSEIKDVEVFAKGMEILFEVAMKFSNLRYIDLGGGFKVPYAPGEEGTNLQKLAARVADAFHSFEKQYGRRLELWFEPGKYLVSEAGYFITRVNVLKQSGSICFAGINSGLNHLIRPMFYGSYHEIENISNPDGPLQAYTVVGNICETDTFAEDRMLPALREGDLLVFLNAGAYGFEMASNYNARFKPAEILLMDGKSHLIRQRDTLDDLLSKQIEVL